MGIFRRTETPADDNARTEILLDHADRAFGMDDAYALADGFEDVVMDGLMTDKGSPSYPPPGHGYPSR